MVIVTDLYSSLEG